jgi:hypothetical protein
MHHIAKYYMYIKPLKVLYVPPCVQIQDQNLASNPIVSHANAKPQNLGHQTCGLNGRQI